MSVMLTSILTVGVGHHEFGLPLRAVLRTLRLPRGLLRPLGPDGDAAFALEGRLLPLVPVRSLLDLPDRGLPAAAGAGEEASIVLIGPEGQETGLEVDRLGERMDVVLRPLGGLLAGTEGYVGTTLLGGGQVLLVLDPDWLAR
jgi:two-component system chemotaxis sensor kinase CheA